MKNQAILLLQNCRVCARIELNESAVSVAKQAIAAGAEALELCFCGRGSAAQFSDVLSRFGRDILIGAGNITSSDTAFEAVDLGARFLATPLHEVSIFKSGSSLDVPVIAEAFTPLEVRRAALLSADMIRLFPACMITDHYVEELNTLDLSVPLAVAGLVDPAQIPLLYQAGICCFFAPANPTLSDVIRAALEA